MTITPLIQAMRDAGLYWRATGGGIDFPAHKSGSDVEGVIMLKYSDGLDHVDSDESLDSPAVITRVTDHWYSIAVMYEGTLGDCVARLGAWDWPDFMGATSLYTES